MMKYVEAVKYAKEKAEKGCEKIRRKNEEDCNKGNNTIKINRIKKVLFCYQLYSTLDEVFLRGFFIFSQKNSRTKPRIKSLV